MPEENNINNEDDSEDSGYYFFWAVETCYTCGVYFGLTEDHKRTLLENGKTFYCPNGHGQSFTKSKDAQLQELKKELEAEKNKNVQAEMKTIQLEKQLKPSTLKKIFKQFKKL